MIRSTFKGHFLFAGVLALAAAGAVTAQNPVIDWNNIAITTALAGSQATAPGSNSQAGGFVYMAYVHLAIYDAVNAIDHRFQSYGPNPFAPAGASKDSAAISAAYHALINYFPDQAATLLSQYNAALAAIPDSEAKLDGRTQGFDRINAQSTDQSKRLVQSKQ
jgi:hypothetical protein